MHAIKAIYDGKSFTPVQPIPVTEKYDVVITFIEPIKKSTQSTKTQSKKPESKVADKSTKLPRSAARGILKGKLWMSDDFDEPLEEMREYME